MKLNRIMSFVGACGLILALTALVPMLPAYADGVDCEGGCIGDPLEGGGETCATDQTSATCSGNGCSCSTKNGLGGSICSCD